MKNFLVFAMLFLASNTSHAAAPDSKFEPGETLTPGCAPGSINCTIDPPSGYSLDSKDALIKDVLTSDNNGNIGIGTLSPGLKLDVDGKIRGDFVGIDGLSCDNDKILRRVGGSWSCFDDLTSVEAGNGLVEGGTGSGVIVHVGESVGVHSEEDTLSVYGLNSDDGLSENVLYVSNEARIGIGTLSPGSKLHVEGGVRGNFVANDGTNCTDGEVLRKVSDSWECVEGMSEIIAGDGLVGGGSDSDSITISLVGQKGIDVSDDVVEVDSSEIIGEGLRIDNNLIGVHGLMTADGSSINVLSIDNNGDVNITGSVDVDGNIKGNFVADDGTACTNGQILKKIGSTWICSNDIDTQNIGDITSVIAGNGLVGGALDNEAQLDIVPGDGLQVDIDSISVRASDLIGSGLRVDSNNVSVYGLVSSDGLRNNAVYVDNSGNVGIGLTNPDDTLEVNGTIRGDFVATNGTVCNDNQVLRKSGSSWVCADDVENDPKIDALYSNVVPRWNSTNSKLENSVMYISSDDRVGIGIDTPESKLHVDGGIRGNFVAMDGTNCNDGELLLKSGTDWACVSSDEWEAAKLAVSVGSGSWSDTSDEVSAKSNSWDAASAAVANGSGSWDDTAELVNSNSLTWNSTSATVSNGSDNWDDAANIVLVRSGSWDDANSWGNHADAGYLSEVDFSDVSNGSGIYLTYKPDNTPCNNDEILRWDGGKWICSTASSLEDTFSANGIMVRTGDNAYSIITDNSSTWDSTATLVSSKSGGWDAATEAVSVGSGSWSDTAALVSSKSSGWDSTTATVSAGSVAWDAAKNTVDNGKDSWDNSAAVVLVRSGSWEEAVSWGNHADAGYLSGADYSDIGNGSGIYLTYKPNGTDCSSSDLLKWDGAKWICTSPFDLDDTFVADGIMVRTGADTYSIITDNSSNWNSAASVVSANSGKWDTTSNIVSLGSGSWDNAASTVNSKSAGWDNAAAWGDHSSEGYLTGVNFSEVANGSGIYMTYKPNDTACSTDEILKWDGSKWICMDLGSVKVHSLSSDDGSIPDALYVDSAGKVGIGMTDPAAKLDVDGAVRADHFYTSAATLHGTAGYSHINLGLGSSETGTSGQDFLNATVSGGNDNKAQKTGTTVGGGDGNTANGSNGTISGGVGNEVTAAYGSIAGGQEAKSYLHGQFSQSTGMFASAGDAQFSRVVSRNSLAGSETKELFLDGVSQRMIMPDNTTWLFKTNIVLRSSTGENGAYIIEGVISKDAAGDVAISDVVRHWVIAEDESWVVDAVADNTNKSLKIEVTSLTNSLKAVAVTELIEVSN